MFALKYILLASICRPHELDVRVDFPLLTEERKGPLMCAEK